MWPTRNQWRSWSTPSKLTAVGVLVGVLSLLVGLLAWLLPRGMIEIGPDEPAATWNESGAGRSQVQVGEGPKEETLSPLGIDPDSEAVAVTMSGALSPVTFKEFMDVVFSDSLTDLQRDEFFERHLGKTVIWQGIVAGVWERSDRTISVLLAIPASSRRYRAFLDFAPEYKSELIRLDHDTEIKVVCRLKDWGVQAELDRCQLLRVLSEADPEHSLTDALPP